MKRIVSDKMTSVTGLRDLQDKNVELLLQHMTNLHQDRPGISERLISAMELLWLYAKMDYRTACPKSRVLEAHVTVLRFCGDFELQRNSLQCLLLDEDVLEFADYFTEVWFKHEPHLKSSFISLMEDLSDSQITRFLCQFNKSANLELGDVFQFVYSIPITLVHWNSLYLPSDGKGLMMLHLNLGSKSLSMNGVDVPAAVDIRGYLILQGNDICHAEVSFMQSTHGPVIQSLSILTSKDDHLVVHLAPALCEDEWSNVTNFLRYISSIELHFNRSETVGVQTEHVPQQVPCTWQVSSSQGTSIVNVEDEEIDMAEVGKTSVVQDCKESKKGGMLFDLGVSDDAQSVSETLEEGTGKVQDHADAKLSCDSNSKTEMGLGVSFDQTNQIFSENETWNSVTGDSLDVSNHPESDKEDMNYSGNLNGEAEPEASMEMEHAIPQDVTGLSCSENDNFNPRDGISSSSASDQPETAEASISSCVKTACEVEQGVGMDIDQDNDLCDTSRIFSENETLNTSAGISSSSSQDTPKKRVYTRRGRGMRGKRGGRHPSGSKSPYKSNQTNRPVAKRISVIKSELSSRPRTRSLSRSISTLLPNLEVPFQKKATSFEKRTPSRNLEAKAKASLSVDTSPFEDSIQGTEHPVLMPMVNDASNAEVSLVSAPSSISPILMSNPSLTPRGHESSGVSSPCSTPTLSPRHVTAANCSLPNLMPTPLHECFADDGIFPLCGPPPTIPVHPSEMLADFSDGRQCSSLNDDVELHTLTVAAVQLPTYNTSVLSEIQLSS